MRQHGRDYGPVGDEAYEHTEVLTTTNKHGRNYGHVEYMANNHECEIIGIGSVILNLSDNREALLRGVRHVPKLKREMISLGMLDNLGTPFKLERGT